MATNSPTSGRTPRFSHLLPAFLVGITLSGLCGGALLRATGVSRAAGDSLWIATGSIGCAYALWAAINSLRRRRVGIDLIALLALAGALAVEEYLAAGVIAVMIASGRALEEWAAGRANRDLRDLVARAPTFAHRLVGVALETVAVDELSVGDRVLVGTGELVPADGNLLGEGVLDESALTGESLPVERAAGEPVRSGAANAGPPFELTVTAPAAESTYAGVIRLVSEAESSQPGFVRLADRYALLFLAVTLVVSGGAWAVGGPARAVAVLVVATPCPLILAAPIAWVSGLSRSARRGVVTKGGAVLERLARCTTLLVDKTGTLTDGRPALAQVVSAGSIPEDELLRLAASLDQLSPHVLAQGVVQAARRHGYDLVLPDQVEEVPGRGIRGTVAGRGVALGKAEWVGSPAAPAWAKSALRRARLEGSMAMFVAVDGRPAGVLIFDDPIRQDATRTVRALRRSGVERIVMLTGDRREVAETVGAMLGVDEVRAEQSPADKLEAVRLESSRSPVIMVGDGVNDAPALALADVGVAMGARGATASSQVADVVLTVDRLDRLADARFIARRSGHIAWQSVIAGIAMSLVAMGVALAGFLPAVWGALLQEGIDVAVIANALRALRAPSAEVRLDDLENGVATRFQGEHLVIRAVLTRIRHCADQLGNVDPVQAVADVRGVYRLLVEEVIPHESAEQEQLYPIMERLLGGRDPTGPMSRAHLEISHQIRRLGELLDGIGPEGPDEDESSDLRRLLYGLYAVLKLHTAQEEESYLSLRDDSGDPGDVSVSAPSPL